uniref:Uncharacterized protein n=1 Tax=Candidatus Kentrum sp. DK TaxID=2126562 RepID=A0A450SKD3_9GAMM|nr:MAG: hypothetical protein BECKDK2373C_GA0170839_103325 [Candidatus Kentron sp. DK]VFJ53941.1 MAG: hypothetical protein BECKDK2373B_GA0170837_104422 [Candidatus Kentron sp. DK]
MNTVTTTDPITLRDVPHPEVHPCVYEGDGDNGITIYFESDDTRRAYLDIELPDHKVVQGNSTNDSHQPNKLLSFCA